MTGEPVGHERQADPDCKQAFYTARSLCNLPKTMELNEKLHEMTLMNTGPTRLILYFLTSKYPSKKETILYMEYLKEVRITESRSGLGWKGPPVVSSGPTSLLKQKSSRLNKRCKFSTEFSLRKERHC